MSRALRLALLCAGALAALYERTSSGRGQHVDVSLFDAAFSVLGFGLTAALNGVEVETVPGNRDAMAAPGNVFPKHPTDAVVYALIVRGELSLQLENRKRHVYRKGQLVNIPKGIESELGNLGEEILELFVVKYDYDEPK